jgi:hypothetical protein
MPVVIGSLIRLRRNIGEEGLYDGSVAVVVGVCSENINSLLVTGEGESIVSNPVDW